MTDKQFSGQTPNNDTKKLANINAYRPCVSIQGLKWSAAGGWGVGVVVGIGVGGKWVRMWLGYDGDGYGDGAIGRVDTWDVHCEQTLLI